MKTTSKVIGLVLIPIFSFVLGWQFASDHRENSQNKEAVVDISNLDPAKTEEFITVFNDLLQKDIDMVLIEEIMTKIDQKYVNPDDIKSDEMTYGLAKGLVSSLSDIHSSYLTPEESSDFQDSLDGSLEGIGAELNMNDNGEIIVVSPLRDSPAKKAGILPQDIIVEVDGEDITNLSLYEVVKKIRGAPGTSVNLSIKRKGADDLIKMDVERAKIHVESVKLEMRDNIAILELNQFGSTTEEEFEKYLAEAILDGAEGIIIDLRFNSGGFLDTAENIVSDFVADGKVVTIETRDDANGVNTGTNPTHYVSGNKKTDLPLVILQNGGSASASEIMAGALQDHGRATIVGETSFGKGTVQEVIPLQHGGNLKLTIAKWYTPNGKSINEVGITPDVFVENTIEDYEAGRDPQMDKAIEVLKEKMGN